MNTTVLDSSTGESLPGAVITSQGGFETKAQTDVNGDVFLNAGKYTARMIGYTPKDFEVTNKPVEVKLDLVGIDKPEVLIEAARPVKFNFKWWWIVAVIVIVLVMKKK